MIRFLVLFFLISPHFLVAQIRYGAKVGYNLTQHYGVKDSKDDYTVQSTSRHGINGGVFVYLPITAKFGMQYESLYSQKGSDQIITVTVFDEKIPLDVRYQTDYWEVPILFAYDFFLTEHITYRSISGTAMSLLLKNFYQLDGIWLDDDGETKMYAREHHFDMEMFDFSFVYGGEVVLKTRLADWLFSYRFTLGWNPILLPTYAYLPMEGEAEPFFVDNPPVQLKNQTYSFSLGIIF